MSLEAQALAISVVIAVFASIPFFIKTSRSASEKFLLFGTGAFLGIVMFDLIPDVYEVGGIPSLIGILVVGLLATFLHKEHHPHTPHEHHGHGECAHQHEDPEALPRALIVFSMSFHCFTSGVLLAVANSVSTEFEHSVLRSLVVHKAYEDLSIALFVRQISPKKGRAIRLIALYILSFPAGFIAMSLASRFGTSLWNHAFIQHGTVWIAVVSLGTLAGCLIVDFVKPSLHHVRQNLRQLAWITLGMVLSYALTSGGGH